MEYTVGQLSELAGVSTRTLRYYDQIGLLCPAKTTPAGYRIYGRDEVNRLQQILFYRELGVELESIKALLEEPGFDGAVALKEHKRKLLERRAQLDALIANVEKSILALEGKIAMSDKEKFEGFKRQLIDENERKYGKEARERWGDDVVDKSNAKLMGMSEEKFSEAQRIEAQMQQALLQAMETGDPAGELAQEAARLHHTWLEFWWPSYSKEAHAGLARMYVDDERFAAYYDQIKQGAAVFLRDAILVYTGQN